MPTLPSRGTGFRLIGRAPARSLVQPEPSGQRGANCRRQWRLWPSCGPPPSGPLPCGWPNGASGGGATSCTACDDGGAGASMWVTIAGGPFPPSPRRGAAPSASAGVGPLGPFDFGGGGGVGGSAAVPGVDVAGRGVDVAGAAEDGGDAVAMVTSNSVACTVPAGAVCAMATPAVAAEVPEGAMLEAATPLAWLPVTAGAGAVGAGEFPPPFTGAVTPPDPGTPLGGVPDRSEGFDRLDDPSALRVRCPSDDFPGMVWNPTTRRRVARAPLMAPAVESCRRCVVAKWTPIGAWGVTTGVAVSGTRADPSRRRD